MCQIRMLQISFKTSIRSFELPFFRGAIIDKVGLEHELFHNHKNNADAAAPKNKSFRYDYPLIQYKVKPNGTRLEPMLLLLGDGVDEAIKLFEKSDLNIRLRERTIPLKVSTFDVNLFDLQTGEFFPYNIFKWQALNSEKYALYNTLDSLAEQIRFLEEQLVKNIMAFAIGIGWKPDKRIEVKILNIMQQKMVQYKNVRVLCFDLSLKANVRLPEFIGLGKGVTRGFGVLRQGNKAKFQGRKFMHFS